MPRHSATINPELRAHQEWLGYLQPVGLVVAPAAMVDAGWVVTRSGSELIERQERYREAIQGLSSAGDSADSDPEADGDTRTRGFPQLETLLVDHLGWSADQIQSEPARIESYSRHLPELGETLRPTALVPAAHGEGVKRLRFWSSSFRCRLTSPSLRPSAEPAGSITWHGSTCLGRCCGPITALARATLICWWNSRRSNLLSLSMPISGLRNSSPTASALRWIW